MRRLFALLTLFAVALGIAGLAVTTERSSAQQLPNGDRFNLHCQQTVAPADNNGVGEVKCSLSVDLPDPLPDLKLNLTITYADRDGSNDPSRGDRPLCLKAEHNGTVIFDRCRGGGMSGPNGL